MAISWIWILGMMGLTDTHFNIVNIILSTFIFGLGDDYTIFIVDGLMYEYASKKRILSIYKTSVLLSAVTMFAGVGALILSVHPAMRSLGEVTVIGMVCVVLVAFIIPPFLFKWMTQTGGRTRMMPVTLKNMAASAYSIFVFLVGSLGLSAYGFFLLKLRKPTEERKLKFHKALCGVSRFVVRYIPGVQCRLENTAAEDFSRPGIVICNHQSHLDLMYLLMLSPNIIVLTNQWVWNCFFYGRIIRFADFYPVANGMEHCVDELGVLVAKGYSIAVFPEATRSEDCRIGRFHKGAFYLAEKLRLDLIPVILHGVGHVLPKREFLLREGEVHVRILPRIRPDSTEYGLDCGERARQIRRLFIREYEAIASRVETPAYYRQYVLGNYLYKGKKVERAARRELNDLTGIARMLADVPAGANVLVKDCGVGALALLCSLVRKDIYIYAVDDDADAIDIASNCRIVPRERLSFHTTLPEDVGTDILNNLVPLAACKV
jgi:1-acyl-sn-glycerol-3-phosphate acyltransferase